MNIDKLRELEPGEEVTVITTGNFQLVDVASSIKFPPLTEVTTPLTPFVENQLRQGNLTLTSEDDAPKAKGKAANAEDLNYEAEATLTRSSREDRVESRKSQNSSTGNEALTSTSTRSRKASETEKE